MAKAMSIYRELASLSEDVYDQDVSLLTTFKDGSEFQSHALIVYSQEQGLLLAVWEKDGSC
jgi:hypothetical protein